MCEEAAPLSNGTLPAGHALFAGGSMTNDSGQAQVSGEVFSRALTKLLESGLFSPDEAQQLIAEIEAKADGLKSVDVHAALDRIVSRGGDA